MNRNIMTESQLERLMDYMRNMPLPFTVTVNPGKLRTLSQNALCHKWYAEIAHQRGDMEPYEVKRECKAYHGVPILLAEDAKFAEAYDLVIRPRPREDKLKAMDILPVTSRMNPDQHGRYMDAVYRKYSKQGIVLTEPEREAA